MNRYNRKYSKKPSGYFWRIRKRVKAQVHENDTIFLNDYPNRARQYIVLMVFSELPYGIKVVH